MEVNFSNADFIATEFVYVIKIHPSMFSTENGTCSCYTFFLQGRTKLIRYIALNGRILFTVR